MTDVPRYNHDIGGLRYALRRTGPKRSASEAEAEHLDVTPAGFRPD